MLSRVASAELEPPAYPFADKAGTASSTAIHKDSPRFSGWADGYTNLIYGTQVAERWQTPTRALGKAEGTSSDIVCLGRGGEITLSFSKPIIDGDGFDFAIFENACSDLFLELAWVEVSSDGIHFVRFPNYYGEGKPVGAFGEHAPTQIYGLASKYKLGYGHPFDLSALKVAYDAVKSGGKPTFFSNAFADSLRTNYPHLDLNAVRYIRLIDIIGNGSAFDTNDNIIYDPYPTVISAGFDLDAIGVIHQQTSGLLSQHISFSPIPSQKRSFRQLELTAISDSGLPVTFTINHGPATLTGHVLTFTGKGLVEISAHQAGNEIYDPATPTTQTFTIADHIQHLYVAPIPDLPIHTTDYPIYAVSSSGLPVTLEILHGPDESVVGSLTHLLDTGPTTGSLTLHAYQQGSKTTAPAEDIFVVLEIRPTNSTLALLSFADWCAASNSTSSATADDDGDQASNFEEYMAGTDPNSFNSRPTAETAIAIDQYGRTVLRINTRLQKRARGTLRVNQSNNLLDWTDVVPSTHSQQVKSDYLELELDLPTDNEKLFYRLQFEN